MNPVAPSQNYKILSKALQSIELKAFTTNYQVLISYDTTNMPMVNFIESLSVENILHVINGPQKSGIFSGTI